MSQALATERAVIEAFWTIIKADTCNKRAMSVRMNSLVHIHGESPAQALLTVSGHDKFNDELVQFAMALVDGRTPAAEYWTRL